MAQTLLVPPTAHPTAHPAAHLAAHLASRPTERWADGPLVGFDTETTGVDVEADRVVTAALVRRERGTSSVTRWLLDPGVEIPDGAAAIHGVTTAHARAHGRPAGEGLDEIATAVAGAVRRGEALVAFNASYDLSLLDAELSRHGLASLAERAGGPLRGVVDPLVLDRHLDRYRPGKRRLGDLCAHYGVRTDALHAADADVAATLDLLAAMARVHPVIAATPLAELHELQVAAHRAWAESFNAWRRGQGFTGPGAETSWPTRGLVVATVTLGPRETDVRPAARACPAPA